MTTTNLADYRLSPEIIISRDEYRTLVGLTGAASRVADDLLQEIERATIVDDDRVPSDVARMGSIITYRTPAGARTVELVYPADADIARARISILTPIGTALIGLRAGQSISWTTRDGRREALTVLRVLAPAPRDPEPPAAA
jgi:regulator of nucleoside diphosphate kinase